MDAKYIQFVNFKVVFCFLSSFMSCHCFLIEPDNAVKPNRNITGQFLAINEFLAEKKELTHQIDEMNHQIYRLKYDSDQTITILTEQLKQKLSIMENRVNETSKQNVNAELLNLKEKYTLMAGNLSKERENYRDLQNRFNIQDSEVRRLTNLTLQLEKTVSALEKLKIVNQTINLQTMERHVQSLQQKTNLLENNQNARNQDFLALYNLTLASSKSAIQLKKDFRIDIQKFAENQTQTFDNLNIQIKRMFTDFSQAQTQLQSIINDQNVTIGDVHAEMAKMGDIILGNNRKVALTTSSAGGIFSDGIVKFTHIFTSIGINNIAAFKSTGKFVCEIPGLYYISAYIRTASDDYEYVLKKNEVVISKSATVDWQGNGAGRSTTCISAATDCQKNDELYLFISTVISVESSYSILNVLKIK